LSPSSLSTDGYIQSSSLMVFVKSRNFFRRCSYRSANTHKCVVSCNLMAAILDSGGAVWWTLTRWRQLWCVCSVKTVWSIPECFRGELLTMGRYTNLPSFILLYINRHTPITPIYTVSQKTSIFIVLNNSMKNHLIFIVEIWFFHTYQGSAATVKRNGRICNHLMLNFLRILCTKNHWNQMFLTELLKKQKWTFLRHSVVQVMVYKWN